MTDAEILVQGAPRVTAGRRTLVWRRFRRNTPAVVGAVILVVLFVVSYALPPFLAYDHQQLDYTALLKPPSARHPFGTTQIGQDVLAQTLRGLQKSLVIGVCVALISTTIAATAGAVAGLLGGWTDRAIMWLVDLLLVVPSFIIIAIFAPRTKGSGSMVLLIVLLSVFGWMISARIVRGMTLSLRDREFVRAARYMGAPTRTVITSHILPNIASILIIDTTLAVGSAILAETGLSYLGFGVQPPDVSLGSLIAAGTKSALVYPWLFLFSGGLLIVTVLCANLVGDGLRDAFDPTAHRARSKRSARAEGKAAR
ncbi:ABC transporter permease [Nocardia takedensis]|uniref:ABC transporter permease n=1 Tax=Nocardia takedensis TaxID=259390 RepID=UPI0002F7676E|nr:ABC transporter permease [Nocardia takedensis]